MARREPLTNEQRQLLKIAARMPLASVANLEMWPETPILPKSPFSVRRL